MSISTEEKDRYLRETAIVLAREGFQTDRTDTGKLRVLLDGALLCEVTENGGITYRNEDINEPERVAAKDIICFVTYIAAAYFPIEWLVGNGAMVMRYQLFDANGLSYRKELVFTLLLLLLSIGAGYLLIQRKDLISLEK